MICLEMTTQRRDFINETFIVPKAQPMLAHENSVRMNKSNDSRADCTQAILSRLALHILDRGTQKKAIDILPFVLACNPRRIVDLLYLHVYKHAIIVDGNRVPESTARPFLLPIIV